MDEKRKISCFPKIKPHGEGLEAGGKRPLCLEGLLDDFKRALAL
jgi:hypothetical protein